MRMIPRMMRPTIAMTFKLENQNSISPKTLVPRKLTARMRTKNTVMYTAG
jgi:hypothetical protein